MRKIETGTSGPDHPTETDGPIVQTFAQNGSAAG